MTTPRRPPGRYDERRGSSRALTVVAAVVVAALVAAAVTTLYGRYTRSRLPHQVRGFEVVSDAAVRVTFEVKLARGKRGECVVRARGRDGAEVGRKTTAVGPGTGGVLVTTYELATSARASTGEVAGCRPVADPE